MRCWLIRVTGAFRKPFATFHNCYFIQPLHLPRLRNLPDGGLLEAGVADATGEQLLKQPFLDPPGLLDDLLGRRDGLVHRRENRRNLPLFGEGEYDADLSSHHC